MVRLFIKGSCLAHVVVEFGPRYHHLRVVKGNLLHGDFLLLFDQGNGDLLGLIKVHAFLDIVVRNYLRFSLSVTLLRYLNDLHKIDLCNGRSLSEYDTTAFLPLISSFAVLFFDFLHNESLATAGSSSLLLKQLLHKILNSLAVLLLIYGPRGRHLCSRCLLYMRLGCEQLI